MKDTYLYGKRWRQERAQGILRIVDATEAKRRLDTLVGAGWSARAIAGTAGVSVQCITKILNGQPRANRTTVAAILTVDPETVPQAASKQTTEPFVPRVGAVRRIQALLAMGWPHHEQQRRSGVSTAMILSQRGRWITRSTHDKIAALFTELAMTHGPSAHSRGWARRLGYALPLQWDDIDHDPAPTVNNHEQLQRDRGALVEDLTFLADHGVGITEAARRVGMGAKTLDKYLRRGDSDQVTLLNRLTAADPTPIRGGRVA